ncbi:uncharacterized protein LOC132550342 [Ylistrum balloti]|uniref:uncharacterized protein LOC132550342 n=1 Tax=Ylistrum balloti TaxID=509963 RepID=UPI002905F067|nr:uncharacterized protein LOC132550342 [Ylistrum balloti]
MEKSYLSRSASMDSLLTEDETELMRQYMHFYNERIITTEQFKKNVMDSRPRNIKEPVLDTAMDTLRKEMAAMMDKDLELAKQLLILHETIEDLLAEDNNCETCNSSDTCSEISMCTSCSLSKNTLEDELSVSSDESAHKKYLSVDSEKVDRCTPVKQLKRRSHGGHQKQNSNDSGYCCIFQDLEVTI